MDNHSETPKAFASASGSGVLAAFGGQVVGKAIRFVCFNVFFARLLGAEAFGVFILAFFGVQLLHLLSLFGLQNSISRLVPEALGQNNRPLAVAYLRASFVIALAVSVVISIITYFGAPTIAFRLFEMPVLSPTLQIMSLSIPIFVGLSLVSFTFRSLGFPGRFIVTRDILPYLTLGLVSPLLLHGVPTSQQVAQVTVLCLGIGLLMGCFALYKKAPYLLRRSAVLVRWKPLLTVAATTAMGNLIAFLLVQMDRAMLGILQDAASAGTYSVASAFAAQIFVIAVSLNAVFVPRVAFLHQRHPDDAAKMTRTTLRWAYLFSLPVTALMIILAEPLLMLSGPEYSGGRSTLIILALGYGCAGVATGIIGQALQMTGYHRWHFVVSIVTLACNLGLNLMLIPLFGLEGASVATGCSMVLSAVMCLWGVRRRFGQPPVSLRVMQPFVGAVVAAFGAWVVLDFLGPWVAAALFAVVYTALFFFVFKDADDLRLWAEVRSKLSSVRV